MPKRRLNQSLSIGSAKNAKKNTSVKNSHPSAEDQSSKAMKRATRRNPASGENGSSLVAAETEPGMLNKRRKQSLSIGTAKKAKNKNSVQDPSTSEEGRSASPVSSKAMRRATRRNPTNNETGSSLVATETGQESPNKRRKQSLAIGSAENVKKTTSVQDPSTIAEASTSSDSTDAPDCPICLESTRGMEITSLPCVHVFHQGCIDRWFLNSTLCPVCRYETAPFENVRPFRDWFRSFRHVRDANNNTRPPSNHSMRLRRHNVGFRLRENNDGSVIINSDGMEMRVGNSGLEVRLDNGNYLILTHTRAEYRINGVILNGADLGMNIVRWAAAMRTAMGNQSRRR